MNSQYDKEIEHLDEQLSNGSITQKEYNESVREIERDFRYSVIERAEQAYDEVINNGDW